MRAAVLRLGALCLGPVCALLAPACRGPALQLRNTSAELGANHRTFVDGIEQHTEILPFRYYGTTRWDALPAEQLENGIPTFAFRPASGRVTIAPPASLWLFPIDFPIELVDYLLHGPRDRSVAVAVLANERGNPAGEIAPADVGTLRDRALRARTER